MKARHYKTLRGKHRQNTFDIKCRKIFSDPPPRVRRIKTKINKWNLINLTRLCTAKETKNKMKRQPTKWEKVFANKATDKGLISKIIKQFMQISIKKTQTTQSINWQKT